MRRRYSKVKGKTRLLTNWTVIPLKDGAVAVQGLFNSGNKTDLWQSTPIIARKDYLTVESTNKTIYKLKGQIDKQHSHDEGIPPNFIDAFYNGFPENWNCIFKNYWKVHNTTSIQRGECERLPFKGDDTGLKKSHQPAQPRNIPPDTLLINFFKNPQMPKESCAKQCDKMTVENGMKQQKKRRATALDKRNHQDACEALNIQPYTYLANHVSTCGLEGRTDKDRKVLEQFSRNDGTMKLQSGRCMNNNANYNHEKKNKYSNCDNISAFISTKGKTATLAKCCLSNELHSSQSNKLRNDLLHDYNDAKKATNRMQSKQNKAECKHKCVKEANNSIFEKILMKEELYSEKHLTGNKIQAQENAAELRHLRNGKVIVLSKNHPPNCTTKSIKMQNNNSNSTTNCKSVPAVKKTSNGKENVEIQKQAIQHCKTLDFQSKKEARVPKRKPPISNSTVSAKKQKKNDDCQKQSGAETTKMTLRQRKKIGNEESELMQKSTVSAKKQKKSDECQKQSGAETTKMTMKQRKKIDNEESELMQKAEPISSEISKKIPVVKTKRQVPLLNSKLQTKVFRDYNIKPVKIILEQCSLPLLLQTGATGMEHNSQLKRHKNKRAANFGISNDLNQKTVATKVDLEKTFNKKYSSSSNKIKNSSKSKIRKNVAEQEVQREDVSTDTCSIPQSIDSALTMDKSENLKKINVKPVLSSECPVLTARRGTKKRKMQLKELLNQLNEGYQDDYFESPPLKKHPSMFTADFLDTDSEVSSIRTPIMDKPLFEPVSAKKTPTYGTVASPDVLLQQRGNVKIVWKKDRKKTKNATKKQDNVIEQKISNYYEFNKHIHRIFSSNGIEVTESENSDSDDNNSSNEVDK